MFVVPFSYFQATNATILPNPTDDVHTAAELGSLPYTNTRQVPDGPADCRVFYGCSPFTCHSSAVSGVNDVNIDLGHPYFIQLHFCIIAKVVIMEFPQ